MPPLHSATMEFLRFLNGNPNVRRQIRALPGKTLLYAGDLPNHFATLWLAALPVASRPTSARTRGGVVMNGVWNRLETPADREPQLHDKQTLPQVLERIVLPATPHGTLLEYARYVHRRVPPMPDQSILWRALSGIFASNAVGGVSFYLGADVTATKVFATTEIPVLLRNAKIDGLTREMLAYYRLCIARGHTNMPSLIRD
jgi:hypothetical protein